MESVGQLIVNLQRDLHDIGASLGGGTAQALPELAQLQSAIEGAQAELQQQAHQYVLDVTAAQAPTSSRPVRRKGLPRPVPKPPPATAKLSEQLSYPFGIVSHAAKMPRQRPRGDPDWGIRARGTTAPPCHFLPKMNRRDPTQRLPGLTEYDLGKGVCTLEARGFIPKAVDLTPAFERGRPVLGARQTELHDFDLKFDRRPPPPENILALCRLDLRPPGLAHSASAPVLRAASPKRPGSKPLPALPAPPAADGPGFFFTELAGAPGLDAAPPAAPQATESAPAAPVKPAKQEHISQAKMKEMAATKIQALFRGWQQRKLFVLLKEEAAAALYLQRRWGAVRMRLKSKVAMANRAEEDRLLHERLMNELAVDWAAVKQQRRVEVHVCSLTLPESRRSTRAAYQALQARQISRIFRVFDDDRDVIFVAPRIFDEEALDYYSKLMQLRGIQNPAGRFQIVVPENGWLIPHISLTQALLVSPKALQRVKTLVNNRHAMLFTEVVARAELRLVGALKLPLLACSPQKMKHLSSKSTGKSLCAAARLPHGPWADDIKDQDYFFTALARLVIQHPRVQRWLCKLADERESRGHVLVEVTKIRDVVDFVRARLQRRSKVATETPRTDCTALVPFADKGDEDVEVLAGLLREHVPKRAVICNKVAYADFEAWLSEVRAHGVVIQAVAEGVVAHTSVHLEIEPDGEVVVRGSTEATMGGAFLRAAAWHPATGGSWQVLRECALRMGRTLSEEGMVGHASIDVVFFENPAFAGAVAADGDEVPADKADDVSLLLGDQSRVGASSRSRLACWVVDIDTRLTDEAAALWPLHSVAQVRQDMLTGCLHVAPEASGLSKPWTVPEDWTEKQIEKSRRWAMCCTASHVPGLNRRGYQPLFQAARLRGVTFDPLSNTGCIFEFLDVPNSLFSMVAVDRTPASTAKRLGSALEVMGEPQLDSRGPGRRARLRGTYKKQPPLPTHALLRDGCTIADAKNAVREANKVFRLLEAREAALQDMAEDSAEDEVARACGLGSRPPSPLPALCDAGERSA
eukprot:TRINITY_DN80184_c0_g1_i1.p1 TRINITY_DN80184_c0_g1~~TRINITY_DN80184_c0_g1_i1.p1  ORF type:complete len:1036 (+),score=232.72 TRINITY_DN80184_c0_g1_i1:140-3247(+)